MDFLREIGSDLDEEPVLGDQRVFRHRQNYLATLSESEFIRRFRVSKRTFTNLLNDVKPAIEPSTLRSHSVSAETKLYATLRFYATGSFFTTIGDFSGISEATTSRVVRETSLAIANLRPNYIYMPRNGEEIRSSFSKFFNSYGFPTVIGAIDCTHIKISGQGRDGEVYRNRKQYFSINTQVIGSQDLRIQNIVARWPGSTHDSHIFSNSVIKTKMESGQFNPGILLGDGGYKLETYLLTPFRNPETVAQQAYNRVHIRARNTVERLFGVWKSRFPCLVFGLRTKVETSMIIIIACAVVHNICIMNRDSMPDNDADIFDMIEEDLVESAIGNREISTNRRAIALRNRIADQIISISN